MLNETDLHGNSSLGDCDTWKDSAFFRVITLGSLIPGLLVVLFNVTNLLVFFKWKHKQPFLIHHISLSFAELVWGCAAMVGPISRYLDHRYISWSTEISLIAHSIPLVNSLIMVISLDRWLFVDYPSFYRHYFTKRAVVVINVITWATVFGIHLTIFFIVRSNQSVVRIVCKGLPVVLLTSTPWITFYNSNFYIVLCLSGLPQLRLSYLAVKARWNIFRESKLGCLGSHEQKIIGNTMLLTRMFKSVVAGSTIVSASIVCQIVARLIYRKLMIHGDSKTYLLLFFSFNAIKDMLPFFFYVVCYPQFRMHLRKVTCR